MRQHLLVETHSRKKATRVGRGIAAGQGKTAGRGTKGQKSRTGANSNIPRTFAGGTTPMVQRLPKLKGFTSHRIKLVAINMVRLTAHFDKGATISIASLAEKNLVTAKDIVKGIKIVGASAPIENTFIFDTSDSRLHLSKSLTPTTK